MKSFRNYSNLTESSLWGAGVKRKPKQYAQGFLDLWKDGKSFTLDDGTGSVKLVYNKKQADALKFAVDKKDLEKEELENYLKDNGWEVTDNGTPLMTIADGKRKGEKININKLGKANVNPTKGPTGAQWESLICIAYNLRKSGITKYDGKPSIEWGDIEFGIDKDTFVKVFPFWEVYGETAMKLGVNFSKKFSGKMEQTGAGGGGVSLSSDWSRWGGSNKTPKTDIKTDQRISLKKAGGAQLMSASVKESIATFNAAMQLMSANSKEREWLNYVIGSIEKNFQTLVMEGSIKDLKKGTGFAKKLKASATAKTKEGKTYADLQKDLATGNQVNDNMTRLMEQIFNGDLSGDFAKHIKGQAGGIEKATKFHKRFKEHFVFEAASGLRKFANNDATAGYLVEFDADRGNITFNEQIGSMSSISDFQISRVIKNMAARTNFYVSFKTGSKNPYSSLRASVKAEETNFSDFDGLPTLRDLVFETLKEDGTILLTEGYQELDEWALVRQAFDRVKKRASKVKGWVQDKAEAAMKWLGGFVKKLFEKVKKALKALVNLGAKAMHGLFNFFGVDLKSVTSDGPAIIFNKMV